MDSNINKIGFAGTFYTLWNICTEDVHHTDMRGDVHKTGVRCNYNYIKNISTDLEKAKSLHPDLEVDEDLYGRNTSWSKFTPIEQIDLTPNILKFGKYKDQDINDLVDTDLDYIVWVSNTNYSANGVYAKTHPKVLQYYIDEANTKSAIKAKTDELLESITKEGKITVTLERNFGLYENTASTNFIKDGVNINLRLQSPNFKEMSYQGHDYALPTIGGKSKRIKGKEVIFEVIGVEREEFYDEIIVYINVKLLAIN